jgi:hypothetical protein
MATAAFGTLLLGLLPRGSVLAMVAVVGTSLALALGCGLLSLLSPERKLAHAAGAGQRRQMAGELGGVRPPAD